MNKIYRNIIRYGLIFCAMFSIQYSANTKGDFWYAFIIVLAFCIGFLLSQHIKDIEEYLNKRYKIEG